MTIIFDLVLVLLCLGLLILGAEWLVQGAVIIAKRKRVSDLIIASTLIAFGTGLPTIAVNVAFMLFNPSSVDTVIGNALGTNLVNIGLGLGIPALLLTIRTKYKVFEKGITIFLGVSALLVTFALDGQVNRVEGLIILVTYIITLLIMYQYSKREQIVKGDEKQVDLDTSTLSVTPTHELHAWKAYSLVTIGSILLIFFSILLAYMGPRLAIDFNISEYVLGLTIIGIGTSLPMIVTSIKSAYKGYTDIILGNVFGSTIANIGLGIGIPALIAPLIFNSEAISDLYFFSILNMFVVFCLLIENKIFGKNKTLNKISGLIIVVSYLAYLISKLC